MNISISPGNTKIGKTANISLPPITACASGLPCYEKCYARKSYNQYPNVRKAWGGNYEVAYGNRYKYFELIKDYLSKTKRKYFRWHVAGDILDQEYLDSMVAIAKLFPHIKFLAHTKRYDLEFDTSLPNLRFWLSTWPGLNLPKEHHVGLSWSWLSHDERKPENTFECTGSCEDCRYCWDIEYDDVQDILFKLH